MRATMSGMIAMKSMRTRDDQKIGFVRFSIGIKAFALRKPRSDDEANNLDDDGGGVNANER
jgi:hypothetical protein